MNFQPLIQDRLLDYALGEQSEELEKLVSQNAKPLNNDHNLDYILESISDETQVVLIGEATHGTLEFNTMRSELTKRLISERGFSMIAIEADVPDTLPLNMFVVSGGSSDNDRLRNVFSKFNRYPQWKWNNEVIQEFVLWLKQHNNNNNNNKNRENTTYHDVEIFGIDLYSLQSSREEVIKYLKSVDTIMAQRVEQQYACFDKFGDKCSIIDTDLYSYRTGLGLSESCKNQVCNVLREMTQQYHMRKDQEVTDEDSFIGLVNAKVVKNAEEYYRSMMEPENSTTWNLRDRHMFETMLDWRRYLTEKRGGSVPKVVVWAHNSHIGDASHTSMKQLGEISLGQLTRDFFGPTGSFHVGFTTYDGTVTATEHWGTGDSKSIRLSPAVDGSYELLFHNSLRHSQDENCGQFTLIFRSLNHLCQKHVCSRKLVDELSKRKLVHRAIGTVYNTQDDQSMYYMQSCLPKEFDAVIHVDCSRAFRIPCFPKGSKSPLDSAPSAFPGLTFPLLTLSKREMMEDGYFDPDAYEENSQEVNRDYWKRAK